MFARAGEEGGFHDADCGEELEGGGEEDGEGVEELDAVDEFGVLGEVEDHDGFGLGAEGGVGEGTHGDEDAGDDDHDNGQHAWELFGLAHGFLDGDEETDTPDVGLASVCKRRLGG